MIVPNHSATLGVRYDHRFQILALTSAPLEQREQSHPHRRIRGRVGIDPRGFGLGASLAGGMGSPQRRGLAYMSRVEASATTSHRPIFDRPPAPVRLQPARRRLGSAAPIADLGPSASFLFIS
jgi:hypothetical protein